MKKFLLFLVICAALCSCQSPEGGVVNKVLSDFGLREKPEGYVSAADKAFPNLNTIGPVEMSRLNTAERQGEVKFQQESGLKGKYYKEVKVYENFYPIDVTPAGHGGGGDRGFVGHIDYMYRVYQSPRVDTRSEAANESASISTDVTGREQYRYNLSQSGEWDGAKGERIRDK